MTDDVSGGTVEMNNRVSIGRSCTTVQVPLEKIRSYSELLLEISEQVAATFLNVLYQIIYAY